MGVSGRTITVQFCGTWDTAFLPQQTEKRLVSCWNLNEDLPGHLAGSSVSSVTLERNGFFVPEQSDTEGFEVGKFYELLRT